MHCIMRTMGISMVSLEPSFSKSLSVCKQGYDQVGQYQQTGLHKVATLRVKKFIKTYTTFLFKMFIL